MMLWRGKISTGVLLFSIAQLSLFGICIESALAEGTNTQATKTFAELDHFFVQSYGPVAGETQKQARPALVVTGFNYDLFLADGSKKSYIGTSDVAEGLKAVSHICAYIYSIARSQWNNPGDSKWQTSLKTCQQAIHNALDQVDQVEWTSPAWPGGESKLKEFIRGSLATAFDFTSSALKKGDITKADYETFAGKYRPTMVATFYLASLDGTYRTLKVLQNWKQEIGDSAWDNLYVVISGSMGRTTAGLTRDTNPGAVTIASMMKPENVKTHMLMAPAASTAEEALQSLGMVLTASGLADATFTTPEAKEVSGFYSALKTFDIPIALNNVRDIVEGLKTGKAKDPVLGLGPVN